MYRPIYLHHYELLRGIIQVSQEYIKMQIDINLVLPPILNYQTNTLARPRHRSGG
jgi:hypothetical protein